MSNLFNEENAIKVAQYMVDHLCEKCGTKSNNHAFDYDFQLSKGRMIDMGDHNTTYQFDVENDSILGSICNNIKNADSFSQEEVDDQENWKRMIINNINENHIDRIKDVVRNQVFKGVQTELVPMRTFELHDIDISPKTDDVVDFLIVVQKMAKQDQLHQPEYLPPGSKKVHEDLLEIHLETKLPLDEIIANKKEAGDPRYASVYGAYKRKYLYDIEMLFSVDYSLSTPEEFIENMKKAKE